MLKRFLHDLSSVPELYSSHHSTMSHQLSSDSARLPSSIGSTPTYSIPTSVSYPSSLLPPTSASSAGHMNHQISTGAPTTSSYQQPTAHQLPPTPNSLVTMMGPNSGSSNPASDQLTSSELPISSVSPVNQQQTQQQPQPGGASPSWSLPITGSGRVGLPSPPSSIQQTHSHQPSHSHQAFATHYATQGFQQPPRPAPHQPFYSWYW